MVWERPGATQQDFARDSYECERDMRQSGHFGTGIVGELNAQAFQERCMVARGWSKQQAAAPVQPVDERTQITNYCLERQPGVELGQCRREEAARRGLRAP
jgi:hypothetical protein